MGREVATEVHCTDSSSLGYELSKTRAHPREVLEATRWREKQRFIETFDETPEDLLAQDSVASADLAPLIADDGDFSRWAALACPTTHFASRSRSDLKRPRTKVLFNGAVPVLPSAFLRPSRYVPTVTGAWKRPGVIHNLESRVAIMGLRDASSTPHLQDKTLLSIGDNLSEILATDKGRSHDPVLNAQLRIRAGLCTQSGIDWRRRHVETKRNPTDHGSRLADEGILLPGQVLRRSARHREALVTRADASSQSVFPPDSMRAAERPQSPPDRATVRPDAGSGTTTTRLGPTSARPCARPKPIALPLHVPPPPEPPPITRPPPGFPRLEDHIHPNIGRRAGRPGMRAQHGRFAIDFCCRLRQADRNMA